MWNISKFISIYLTFCLFYHSFTLHQQHQPGCLQLNFQKKLLNIWGGRLVKVFVDDDGNEEELKHAADKKGKNNELGNFIYICNCIIYLISNILLAIN